MVHIIKFKVQTSKFKGKKVHFIKFNVKTSMFKDKCTFHKVQSSMFKVQSSKYKD